MLRVYFQAAPWALPVTAIALVVLVVVCRPLGRRLHAPAVLVLLTGLAYAGFVAVTMTPSSGAGRRAPRSYSFSSEIDLPMRYLLGTSEPGLNVWLAAPIGIVTAFLVRRYRSPWPVVVALAVPVLAEGFQWAVPWLGRSAFLMNDVVANWLGVAVGVVLGSLLILVSRLFATGVGGRSPGARVR